MDTNNDVTEDGGALGVDLNGNDLLVLNTDLLCIGRGEVNVTLSSDNALGKLDRSAVFGVTKRAGAWLSVSRNPRAVSRPTA